MRRKSEPGGVKRRGRVLYAISIGLALGLLVSLATFSTREHASLGSLRRHSSNLAARFAEQVMAPLAPCCVAPSAACELVEVQERALAEERRKSGSHEMQAGEQGVRSVVVPVVPSRRFSLAVTCQSAAEQDQGA